MKIVTYAETKGFFADLDQAAEQNGPITIQVNDPVPINSALWKRLRRCKGCKDDIKSIMRVTGVDQFASVTVVFGGLLVNLLAGGAYKKYRVRFKFDEGSGPIEIELDPS